MNGSMSRVWPFSAAREQHSNRHREPREQRQPRAVSFLSEHCSLSFSEPQASTSCQPPSAVTKRTSRQPPRRH